MKFSKSWVMEWVRTELSDNALAEQITMAGLEVDAVEAVAGQFNNVVVGEVVECAQHPDADKLRVTKVNVGEAELLDIVCGAPNCRQGLKVCVAKVGATLPGDFTIKKAKLRGQPSHGMLCSFSELGIDVDELPPGERASMDGAVPAETTFAAWIKRQSAARQDQVLGATRGKLMRAGGLDLPAFYDNKGTMLTLDELRQRDAAAFRRAGL